MSINRRAPKRDEQVAAVATVVEQDAEADAEAGVEREGESPEREAAEREARLKGVPQAGGENESADLWERELLVFNRLAYPTGKIPPGWREKAAAHIKTKVPKGRNFQNGAPEAAAPVQGDYGAGTTDTIAQTSAVQPDAVVAVDSVNWTAMGPAPIDNNAASGVGLRQLQCTWHMGDNQRRHKLDATDRLGGRQLQELLEPGHRRRPGLV